MKQSLLSTWRLGWVACVLVLYFCTTTASTGAILAGPITNTANGHIYYLLSPTNWPSAETEAISLGGHLVTINDATENAWVFNRFATNGGVARNLWLGLNDAALEGNWVWVNGEAAAYRNWAPGEPNNGGGFFPDEDQAVMRGPELPFPGAWNDAPGNQIHTPVVELSASPPSSQASYDVALDFSTNSNPNGAWSYGYATVPGGSVTLHAERGRSAGLDFWRTDLWRGVPGAYHNPANTPVTNSTVVLGARQLLLHPGPNAELSLVRFTAPTNGEYRVVGAFTGVDTAGTTADVHISLNGVTFNGSVSGYGAGSGPTFNLIARLGTGDTVEFAVARSGQDSCNESTGLSAQISLDTNAPPVNSAPTITSHPQSRTVLAGTNVTFTVTATGTAPLSYQWRRNQTNLAGATGSSLTLSNVQPANAGTYSVRVTNAFGVATSSNAVLTVLLPQTNCVSAPTGLVSWWRAEGNAVDSAGGNNGVLQGGLAFATGRVGQAFSFDGVNDYVSNAPSASLNVGVGSGLTIECWIKPGDLLISRPVAEWDNNSGQPYGAHFWISANSVTGVLPGSLFANIVDTADNYHIIQSVGGIINTNQFQHVAVTYDKATGVATLYYNGTAVVTQNLGSFTPQTSGPLYIGERHEGEGTGKVFQGLMDEVSLFGRALSAAEIQAIYNAGSAGKCGSAAGIAPTITSHPQSRSVNAGTNITFFVTATGTAPLSYQWRRNQTNLPGATGSSLTLSNVQPANAGTYSVRVSNAFGVAISSNATLNVFTPGTNCAARPPGLVAWWRAEGNANDSAGTNHGTGSHAYAAGEVGQAFNFGGGIMRVPGSPDFLLTNSFTVESWILARQSNNGSILRLGDIGLSMERSPGNVAFEILDANAQSVSLQAPVEINQWHHIAAALDGASGTMTLYVDGVARAQTNTVIRPGWSALPSIQIGALSVYFGWIVSQFHGLIDEVSVYSRALSTNEVHAIYSADGAGKCVDGLAPLILSHPTNQTVAAGANATFTVTATGTAPLSYQWRRNQTNLPGATGSSLTLSNVQPANAGTYSVRVTNAFGSVFSSNAVLTVALAGYDVSANYSLAANPNGVWRYGALSNLAGPLTLLTFSRTFGANNGVPIGEWNPGGVQHPHVNKVLGPGTAVSEGGAFTAPAGTVYFTPGEDGTANNFGVIRFTVPAGGAGNYRIVTAVQPLFDGPTSADSDFHVTRNGVELFGQSLAPNQGTSYSNTVPLAAGDTIDFAIGRGADGVLGKTGLKLQATVAQVAGGSAGSGLTSLVCKPGANATLCFTGVAGNTYTVQTSTNLIDWEVAGIAVADFNGVCEFEDRNSTRFSCRYYRVVEP